MEIKTAQEIAMSPNYQRLVRTRSRYGWLLTFIMLVAYYGYIYLVAFNREFLARSIGEGSIVTVSIPLGIGLIVFTVVITGIYVRRANSEFDRLTLEIIKESGR